MSLKRFFKILAFCFLGILLLLVVVLAVNWKADIPLAELKKKYCNAESEFIEVNGLSVHYRDEGSGETIVLIHGTGASLHTWDDWTKELKQSYRVVRMDLPAFGLTGPSKEAAYKTQDYVDFLDAFVKKIGLNEFYLAGNSLGGKIAWNYALDHPAKVKTLGLIDPSGFLKGKEIPTIIQLAKTPVLNQLVKYITPRFMVEQNIKEVYFEDDRISDELVNRYHEMTLREGNRQAFIDRAKTVDKQNTDQLENIEEPSLILWGREDYWIPLAHADLFHQAIPKSELAIMDDTGHVPMEEKPKESLEIYLKFLQKYSLSWDE